MDAPTTGFHEILPGSPAERLNQLNLCSAPNVSQFYSQFNIIGVNRPDVQPRDFNRGASILRALGHPARLEILFMLEKQEADVTTIQHWLKLSQASTSNHLKTLHSAGIISRRSQGTSVYYTIDDDLGRALLPLLKECEPIWRP